MLIEIRNTSFLNKGAELMLRSIVARLRERMPEAGLAVAPGLKSAPYLQRAELGLYQKMWLHHRRVQLGRLGWIVPRKLRQMFGMVLDSELDVVLDASGYSYCDQWGAGVSEMAAQAIRKWQGQGTKVILMPQAFGPFTGARIKKAFKAIVDGSDLVFARERMSYDYAAELVGERDNLRMAPDFTCLVEGELPEGFDREANRVCVIPNFRMIDMTGKQESKSYLPFLVACVKYLHGKGARPFILIHGGEQDLRLGQAMVEELGDGVNLVQETNALRIKGIIGACDGAVSSRFHGLVNALSQGVPALAAGWSHKYEMLLNDYGFPEGMLSVNAAPEETHAKLDLLVSGSRTEEIKGRILAAAKAERQAAVKMWDDIFAVIGR